MKKISLFPLLAVAIIQLSFATVLHAQSNSFATWVKWNAPNLFPLTGDGRTYATQTTGLLSFADSTSITVTLQGIVMDSSVFGGSAEGFWQSNGFIYSPATSVWTSATLSNLPGNSDRIDLGNLGGVQTLTFSAPVTGLVMNINTLGTWAFPTTGVWQFSEAFTLLSQDLGTRPGKQLFSISGNTISGTESSGTIYFHQPLDSLSWNITQPEGTYYTIGTLMTTVPEPSTYALLLLGGAASLWALKRRKS